MKVANSVYELIGNTPIVKLNNILNENGADVYVKLESFNPGSSVKDRIALNMIECAEKEGIINKDSVLIEPTSGNTGIGLAMIGAAKGYKVILVMPDTMSIERRNLLKAYGAEIILTPGKLGMKGAIDKANELVNNNKNYFMLQQFSNPHNPEAHVNTTAKEILKQMDYDFDAFVAGVGTGGTITGTAQVIKKEIPKVQVVAVEPASSPVLSGGNPSSHKIQGIGAGFVPEVLNLDLIDSIEKVKDEEAIDMMRRLAKEEGLLVGISSGAAIYAALKKAKEMGKGKKVVVIAPDSGERYLSTGIFG